MSFQISNFYISSPDQVGSDLMYKVLADVTESGAVASISSGTITAYDHLKVLCNFPSLSASTVVHARLNGDSGNNYSYDVAKDNAADTTVGATSSIKLSDTNSTSAGAISLELFNTATRVIGNGHTIQSSQRYENGFRYTGAAAITSLSVYPASGNLGAGSRLLVMGM